MRDPRRYLKVGVKTSEGAQNRRLYVSPDEAHVRYRLLDGGHALFTLNEYRSVAKPWAAAKGYTLTHVDTRPPVIAEWLYGDLDPELDRGLAFRVAIMGAELGHRVFVASGFRTWAEQNALYQAYLNGTGNPANAPGTSEHEEGRAIDGYVNGLPLGGSAARRTLAARLGLEFPHMPREPWHVERAS